MLEPARQWPGSRTMPPKPCSRPFGDPESRIPAAIALRCGRCTFCGGNGAWFQQLDRVDLASHASQRASNVLYLVLGLRLRWRKEAVKERSATAISVVGGRFLDGRQTVGSGMLLTRISNLFGFISVPATCFESLKVVRVGVHVCSFPPGDHQTHAPPCGRFLPDMLRTMTKSEGKTKKRRKERKYNVSHAHFGMQWLASFLIRWLPSTSRVPKEFWKE
jgi:hypothetical protein